MALPLVDRPRKCWRVAPFPAMLAALAASVCFLLPWSLRELLEALDVAGSARIARRVSFCVGVAVLFALGLARRRDLWLAKHLFEATKNIKTFKCIAPQVPGEFVVFPVLVVRRQVPSRIVSLDEDFLRVDLDTDHAAGTSSVDALKSLLEASLLGRFPPSSTIITFQGKDAGPTGLAAGLAVPTKDPRLATSCGRVLMDTAACGGKKDDRQ